MGSGSILLLLALAAGAAVTAFISSSRVAVRTPRISLTFVFVGLVLLPAPGALAVAVSALAAGRGAGLAGCHARGLRPALAATLAVAAAQQFHGPPPLDPAHPAALLRLLVAFVVIQGLGSALGFLWAPAIGEIPDGPPARMLRLLAVEAANVPLGWLLALVLSAGAWLEAAVLAALILLALAALIELDRALSELRLSHRALSSRLAELATLGEIGRDLVSSIESPRVFATLERECRKIFHVGSCFVALRDRDDGELRSVYAGGRGVSPARDGDAVRRGIARWVLDERTARRVDDLWQLPSDSPVHGDLLERGTRSVMAVPLVVEKRVLGVLGIQSPRPQAYGDHQLSLLTTIAQQAAIAIENARHYQMATVDSLTGFFLRDHFFRRLAEEDRRVRRYGGRFALLMVDLDAFKAINDRHGHLAGDRYLEQVAGTMREQLRASDLACRYGGDEFCLLLPETGLDGARAIAERIRSAVGDRIVGAFGNALRTTVSIGIAVFPDHDSGDLQGLLRNADDALYRAKRGGRDRVVPFAA